VCVSDKKDKIDKEARQGRQQQVAEGEGEEEEEKRRGSLEEAA